MVPSCLLISGFAPGASATKQLVAFSDCRWDLFCSWALAPAVPLAESRAAALAGEGGQPLLQGQSRQGPTGGSCAAWAQGCFERAGRDTGYQLSEIAVRESQENPTVPASLWSTMGQRCPSPTPRRAASLQCPLSHERGCCTTEPLLAVTSCCVSCFPVFLWLSSSIPSGSNLGLIPHLLFEAVSIPATARAGS